MEREGECGRLRIQAKRNMSVTVLRDENGGYGIVVHFRKTFRQPHKRQRPGPSAHTEQIA